MERRREKGGRQTEGDRNPGKQPLKVTLQFPTKGVWGGMGCRADAEFLIRGKLPQVTLSRLGHYVILACVRV